MPHELNNGTEKPVDPMEQYYGRDALEVARKLFGEDFVKSGEFYSIVEGDLPFKVESYGGGKYSTTNLITEKTSSRGLEGMVVPKEMAETLIRPT
jgi:hypothetical protein